MQWSPPIPKGSLKQVAQTTGIKHLVAAFGRTEGLQFAA